MILRIEVADRVHYGRGASFIDVVAVLRRIGAPSQADIHRMSGRESAADVVPRAIELSKSWMLFV
jgi:hypothetical protein